MKGLRTPHDFETVQAELNNHLIRYINVSAGAVATFAGAAGSTGSTNGAGAASRFNAPLGVAMDAAGAVAIVVSRTHEVVGLIKATEGVCVCVCMCMSEALTPHARHSV